MYIHEAVKKAVKEGRCITTTDFWGGAKIKPTDGKGNCILMGADGSHPSKYGWQPTASQLMQDDWLVVD